MNKQTTQNNNPNIKIIILYKGFSVVTDDLIDAVILSTLEVLAVIMSSPTVLRNNLVKEEDRSVNYIDPISKIFIVAQTSFGLSRLVLFQRIKTISLVLGFAHSLFLCTVVLYIAFVDDTNLYSNALVIDSVHYILFVILNTIVWSRLRLYYQKLQEFDKAVGCRVKVTRSSVKNVISMGITITIVAFTIPYQWYVLNEVTWLCVAYLPRRIVSIIDIYFYGHLLSLLVPRLHLINYYMNVSLNAHEKVVPPNVAELRPKSKLLEAQNCQMKKLMNLYCLVIDAYDVLIDAIKWQFIMALTSTFLTILGVTYMAALMLIRSTRPFINVAIESAFTAMRLFPLFAPCIFADQIQEEVLRLRELLASRLYENKLNKPGRRVARALLALTEARDLSFSLLHVFDIDISLPFKFMGLLITYLIILLQFGKVINP